MNPVKMLLSEISKGQVSFRAASASIEDREDFQSIAKLLIYSDGLGYLDSVNVIKENVTGNRWYELILTTGLSYKGKQYLNEYKVAQEMPKSSNEDILILQPNFAGLGININALLRRFKKS